MSYHDGWAAIHLEMPARVPRTEYSAETHWELVQAVAGIEVDATSPARIQEQAKQAFIGPKGWNYDFLWHTLISSQEFGSFRTRMGHGTDAAGGVDFEDKLTTPFTSPDAVLNFNPLEKLPTPKHAELVDRFEKDYQQRCAVYPDTVNMTGIYITLISGLIELFGWEMLLYAAGINPQRFGEIANQYAAWIQPYFNALADAPVPVVMVHDDIVWTEGAFFHPDWYRKFVFPNYQKLFAPLRESGKKIMFTSDGNFTAFIHDLAQCGIHGFVLEPLTDIAKIIEFYGKTHVIIGNAETRVLLYGNKDQIRAEVERCLNPGKKCPGYFLAVGNHIPSNTPVANALYYNEVYQELCSR